MPESISSNDRLVDVELPLSASRKGVAAMRSALARRGIPAADLRAETTLRQVLARVWESIYGRAGEPASLRSRRQV